MPYVQGINPDSLRNEWDVRMTHDPCPMPLQHPIPNTQHPWGLAAPLVPLSWLYAAGLAAYLLTYKLGIRRRHRLPCRVVSVGNLTFGGTGKSPAVRAICEKLLERGLRPAVLSRGYGGRLSGVGAIVSDGKERFLKPRDCGDEPAALADAMPGVPLAIGKDRRKIGRMLFEQFRPEVIVLDDGMQYWQLHRDAEIVLLDARSPFGSGRTMPAGNLREPVRGIGRADAIVVTGVETVGAERAAEVGQALSALAPRAEVFLARRSPYAVIETDTGQRLPVASLDGSAVVAVSGIANPQSFEAMLAACGADIRESVRFRDHCPYTDRQVEIVEAALRRTGAAVVVTTTKDAVKLRLPGGMYVLDIELAIENVDRLIDMAAGAA